MPEQNGISHPLHEHVSYAYKTYVNVISYRTATAYKLMKN